MINRQRHILKRIWSKSHIQRRLTDASMEERVACLVTQLWGNKLRVSWAVDTGLSLYLLTFNWKQWYESGFRYNPVPLRRIL